jgi:hypothetical protein
MSEPANTPSQEPQNEQHVGPQGAQPAQYHQNPQVAQPPRQNLQAPPQQPFGAPGAVKFNPGFIYEIAMGVFQAIMGLVLVFTGNQIASIFSGGFSASSSGNGAGILILLAGLALIAAGAARPFKAISR